LDVENALPPRLFAPTYARSIPTFKGNDNISHSAPVEGVKPLNKKWPTLQAPLNTVIFVDRVIKVITTHLP
jgi:hypothetical protein